MALVVHHGTVDKWNLGCGPGPTNKVCGFLRSFQLRELTMTPFNLNGCRGRNK